MEYEGEMEAKDHATVFGLTILAMEMGGGAVTMGEAG